jgi:hypothetical protein
VAGRINAKDLTSSIGGSDSDHQRKPRKPLPPKEAYEDMQHKITNLDTKLNGKWDEIDLIR